MRAAISGARPLRPRERMTATRLLVTCDVAACYVALSSVRSCSSGNSYQFAG
jgi:hypothetical protein